MKTILLSTLFFPILSNAFEMHLLKNDKEAVSHAYSWVEHRRAERNAGSTSDQLFDLLADSLNEIESKKEICETALITELSARLENAGVSSTSHEIRNLLISWRSRNRIDDLFFEIVEQGVEANESLLSFRIAPPQSWEITRANKLMEEKGITNFDLSMIYADFKNRTTSRSGCTINRWPGTAKQLFEISGNNEGVRLINIAALHREVISNDEFELVESFRSAEIAEWSIDLSKYLRLLKEIKNKSLSDHPHSSSFLPNSLSSKIRNKKEGVTYRQALYYRFNSAQIRMIEDVLKKTFQRMDATKAEAVFTYKDGVEAIPFSPMGQYYLARKLLRKDLDDLNRSSFFVGTPVTHEDLVTTALETGLVNSEILDSVLKIDDLWNPEIKKWQKISNYAFRVTGTATIFLPPPYNVISSMALVFLDGMIDRKSRKPSQADPDYDVF